MPELVFTGPGPHVYPYTKDAAGVPLGTVTPGDTRDLDEPPDQWWEPGDHPAPEPAAPSRRPRATATPEPGPDAADSTTQEG